MQGLIFNGAPGGGKSTHCERLEKEFGFVAISPGNLLRNIEDLQTPEGEEARRCRRSGGPPMNELNARLVIREISKIPIPEKKGFITDGFPVTEGATQEFFTKNPDYFHSLKCAVIFDVSLETALHRLGGRRIHIPSGRCYHITEKPPRVRDTDDITGEPLTIRRDDYPETIRRRLAFHTSETPHVERYLEAHGVPVVHLDANGTMEEVWEAVIRLLRERTTL